MQKRFALRGIKVVLFLLIFAAIYICIYNVFERKESYIKNGEFLEEENDFDVLFFGTSHVYDGIYPMELWDQYGIFSYNLSSSGSTMGVAYWELINALDYTTPELVVIDGSRISSPDKAPKNTNFVHVPFDHFPLSVNKIRAVYDLIDSEGRMDYLWNFLVYHSRWNELTQEDFRAETAPDKGAELHLGAAIPSEKATLERSEKAASDTIGAEYLRKIIELCQQKNIHVLLIYLPFPASEAKVKEANLMYDIAEEYGVNYINFLEMDGIVNFDTDCYDSHSHLNPSGARKITEYLGTYMQETYGIEDHRGDPAYDSWNKDYEKYTEQKFAVIRNQTSLDLELVMHRDKNISTCIYIKEDSEILQDERMIKLIKNVSPYVDLTQIETAIESGKEYFTIIDNGWCDIWESVDGQSLEALSTTFGSVSYSSTNGSPLLFIQDSEESFLSGVNEEGEMTDVQIVTINKLTGEIIHRSSYAVTGYDDYGNVIASRVN